MTSQFIIITGLHCMQRGLSDRNKAVCPSVCLSDKCVNCDKTNESSPDFLHHMKGQFIYFSDTKNGWWGRRPLLPEILVQTDFPEFPPALQKRYFQSIFARSALTPSEESSIITCQAHYRLSNERKMNTLSLIHI